MRKPNEANKEKFIKSAVSELEEQGVSGFSIRRVARKCGTSCAAPYKHFESRNALMLEVIRYIYKKWEAIQKDTMELNAGCTLREKIVAICTAYVTFLCTYPEYQTIIFMNDRVFPPEMLAEKVKLSAITGHLIDDYCQSVQMPEEVRRRKLFTAKSFLYGSAVMINSGAVPFNSETMEQIRQCINREFEIQ